MCSDFLCEAMFWILCGIWRYAEFLEYIVLSFKIHHTAFHIPPREAWGVPTSPNLGNRDCYLCDYSHPGYEVITLGAFDLHFLMRDKAKHLSVCLLASSERSCLFSSFVCISYQVCSILSSYTHPVLSG